MKIKIIAPGRKPEWGESFWDLKTLCKLTGRKSAGAPLALPTLAALTPPDIQTYLIDENVQPIDFDEKIDLVAITGMTCVILRSYEIADEFRRRGITVVMGGIHASMLPDEALRHSDAVVIGEAENVWEKVVRDAQKGTLQRRYSADNFPDITRSSIPRWDLLKLKAYSYFTIQTSRGCPHDCEFCSVQRFNGRQFRHKDISNVLAEIKSLQGLEPKKTFFFVDDNILAVREYAYELFQRMQEYKIKWWCQASIGGLKDDGLLGLMYKAGCREVFVGLESVSQASLDSIRKSKANKAAEYKDIINQVHSHGIAVVGSFIVGADTDDSKTFDGIRAFIDEVNMPFAMINILTPPPGASLYATLSEEKRISSYDWCKYNGEHLCFTPKLLTRNEIIHGRNDLLRRIYAYPSLYKRLSAVWDKGVFTRNREGTHFSWRTRLFFTFRVFLDWSCHCRRFIIKTLWDKRRISIMSVLMAISFREYAFKSLKDDV